MPEHWDLNGQKAAVQGHIGANHLISESRAINPTTLHGPDIRGAS